MAYFIKYQSGFCANLSTDSCLAQLTIFFERNGKKHMILFDVRKASDTTLYFNKKWNVLVLKSQSLNALNHVSQTEIYIYIYIMIIYIYDLPQALNESGSYLYAEDTWIF